MKKNNLIRKVKQTTAGLLTAAMILTGAPLGSMSAWASVLQPNYDLQVASDSVGLVSGTTYGSSDTTSYAFGNSTGKTGTGGDDTNPTGPLSSFDLAGIVKESDRSNPKKGYADTLKTGYGNSWWQGFYAFGKPKYIANANGSVNADFRIYDSNSTIDKTGTYDSDTGKPDSVNANFSYSDIKSLWTENNVKNGSVKELSDPSGNNIELRQEVKPSDDGQYILVQYTAYNTSNNEVNFMVGHAADTELGNLKDYIFIQMDIPAPVQVVDQGKIISHLLRLIYIQH